MIPGFYGFLVVDDLMKVVYIYPHSRIESSRLAIKSIFGINTESNLHNISFKF